MHPDLATERRRARRIPFRGMAIVRWNALDQACVGDNLSESGVALRPHKAVATLPGAELLVLLAIAGGGWLQIKARLIRAEQVRGRIIWALHFLSRDAETRRQLRRFIAKQRERGASTTPGPELERVTGEIPTPQPRAGETPGETGPHPRAERGSARTGPPTDALARDAEKCEATTEVCTPAKLASLRKS